MRILGVVTLVSPHGEYGGPLRVAVNQLRELAERGHEVVLAGSHRGYAGAPPTQLDGVPLRLYPARTFLPGAGFAGLTSPGLLRGVRSNVRLFDVVHVHAARDLVTLPAARLAQRSGVRTVLQTHGMIDESDNPLAVPLDAALTRPALRSASAVTYLTEKERRSLEAVGRGRTQLTHLSNGVPIAAREEPREGIREVLYLARLAPRKNPVMFAEVASELATEFPDVRFCIVGPDEGAGVEVEQVIAAAGLGDRLRWEGALAPEETLVRMRDASIYVLPSVDEPYPMSVLEAMSVGLPVVVTSSCGLAEFVATHQAGIVVEPSAPALRTAIATLLSDPESARAAGGRGRSAVVETKSMAAIADRLEELYSETG
ncbi:glycosyltransferase [Microbacterium sp. NPDC055521]